MIFTKKATVDGAIGWARGFSEQARAANADAHALGVLADEVERLRAELSYARNLLSPTEALLKDNQALVEKLEAENAELREAIADYFSMPSGEKKNAIRTRLGLPIPARREIKPGAGE